MKIYEHAQARALFDQDCEQSLDYIFASVLYVAASVVWYRVCYYNSSPSNIVEFVT